MPSSETNSFRARESRRDFIRKTTAATALVASGTLLGTRVFGQGAGSGVAVVVDTSDATTKTPPVQWAVGQLRSALEARGVSVRPFSRLADVPADAECILVGSRRASVVAQALASAGVPVPEAAEALVLARGRAAGHAVLAVCGSDGRGLVYALLELADRVYYGDAPLTVLKTARLVEQPANPIRSVARLFSSDVEDKAWFYDQKFWTEYLGMLVAQRFNRFSLTLGLGYNAPRNVPDSYFYFAYPFLLTVPGFNVTARGLPDAERERNLAMLRWIGAETTGRGLHFQLGLWTHAYEFANSPKVNYPIDGLTTETHGPYCRAALEQLLRACPSIDGVTFRCHSESGVPQGSYEFWPMIFEGVARCGRRVEIDIHSKGIEHKLLDMAIKTGMPVNVSPKYWAEHMGLPYHQAGIQKGEKFQRVAGKTATIEQERRFTRYGYGDYLREDRRYGVLYRMWPGTQRFLLWGDPAMAAGYGQLSHFCGSLGLELCEPLSFKGRMGSGLPGERNGYADTALRPAGDWQKHLITYRVWGRLLYNPKTDADGWRRFLRAEFGPAARDCEGALAQASRILPLVTTAHLPSASNNSYWPEIYTNIPIIGGRFTAVHAIDPNLFSSIDEFADELVKATRSGKYSPLDVARWLEALADGADADLAKAKAAIRRPASAAFRRLAIDVAIQSGTGRFLAQKLRAGVAYAVSQRKKSSAALEQAVKHYRAARDTWQKIIDVSRTAYRDDLTYGREPVLRGHWADRLPAIQSDLAAMEKAFSQLPANVPAQPDKAAALFANALASATKPGQRARLAHVPPASFRRGEPLAIELGVPARESIAQVRLHYRRVNQGEEPRVVDLTRQGNTFRQTIPAEYTDSPYAVMYYFELHSNDGQVWLSPGLAADLSNQPYFVVRQTS
ncbi:MAG: hypothetical protein Q7S40_27715 [Opitutaceae bacterium]|nr:hypothetical protein [Opitutaceae bacterium]